PTWRRREAPTRPRFPRRSPRQKPGSNSGCGKRLAFAGKLIPTPRARRIVMTLRPGGTVESMNARGAGRLPRLMGFRVMALEEGLLVAEIATRPELLAPNGYLHAATVIALADTASGYGCIAHLPRGAENFTTAELKCNFLGTARDGTIACVA